LPAGKAQIKVDVEYQGASGERGKPAAVTMSVNGTRVAAGDMPKTIPLQISLGEGLDVGQDVGSAVDFTYQPPFAFTGAVDKVTIDLK
jgi:arylsulfatase